MFHLHLDAQRADATHSPDLVQDKVVRTSLIGIIGNARSISFTQLAELLTCRVDARPTAQGHAQPTGDTEAIDDGYCRYLEKLKQLQRAHPLGWNDGEVEFPRCEPEDEVAQWTNARPGSEHKVWVLTQRHERGLPLWHVGDRLDQGPREASVRRDAPSPTDEPS